MAITETYSNQHSTRWTEQRTEDLKKYWALGLSASQIALKLGVRGRNAIIGKIHRLGLFRVPTGPKKKWYNTKPSGPRQYTKRLPQYVKPKTHPTTTTLTAKKHRERVQLIENIPLSLDPHLARMQGANFDQSIPLDQRKTLLELNHHTCKWPVGDPGTPNFYFCGGFTDAKVYCRHHTMRATR